MSILYRLRCLHRPLQTFGLAAAMAGNAKKIVASKLQKIPIAHAMPSPLREGLRAQPNEPNPLTAVRPARITGLMTPDVVLQLTRLLPDEHDVNPIVDANGEDEPEREHVE